MGADDQGASERLHRQQGRRVPHDIDLDHTAAPRDEVAAQVRRAPLAATAGAGRGGGRAAPYLDPTKDTGNRHLTTMELRRIGQAFENMREAVGWEHDIMCHCHWEMDLASAIQLARVLEPVKPFFLEDPLMVDYNESWDRLMARRPSRS